MRVPTLVGFFDRGFQPHLDQMQHRSIDDPASHRPHKIGMWNTIKVAAEIRINDLPMTRVDQLVDVFYRVQCTALLSIGILFRRQVGLENRFEHQNCCRFPHSIADGGDSQRGLHFNTVSPWAGLRSSILSTHFAAKASRY
jgi:hypothetical protein